MDTEDTADSVDKLEKVDKMDEEDKAGWWIRWSSQNCNILMGILQFSFKYCNILMIICIFLQKNRLDQNLTKKTSENAILS